ncbi:MAG: hypothetical protein ABI977_12660 [Acidobacteriota bacterium]
MTRISAKFTIALFIFLISIIPMTACIRKAGTAQQQSNVTATVSQGNQTPRLSIPDAEWEPFFFKSLEAHIKKINLPSLRTVVLPNKDDLEVRFWIDHLPFTLDGIILRRMDNQWSAVRVYGTSDLQDFPLTQKKLATPKSGWDGAWGKLVHTGILSLPDASEVKCNEIMVDGLSFVVETNFNWSYRTYHYGNPQHAKCDEAKRIISIIQIIFDEFALEKL